MWLSCPTSVLLSSSAPTVPPCHVLTQPPSVEPYTGAECSLRTGGGKTQGTLRQVSTKGTCSAVGGGPATSWLCDSGQVT